MLRQQAWSTACCRTCRTPAVLLCAFPATMIEHTRHMRRCRRAAGAPMIQTTKSWSHSLVSLLDAAVCNCAAVVLGQIDTCKMSRCACRSGKSRGMGRSKCRRTADGGRPSVRDISAGSEVRLHADVADELTNQCNCQQTSVGCAGTLGQPSVAHH